MATATVYVQLYNMRGSQQKMVRPGGAGLMVLVAVSITTPARGQSCMSDSLRGTVYQAGRVPAYQCRRERRDREDSNSNSSYPQMNVFEFVDEEEKVSVDAAADPEGGSDQARPRRQRWGNQLVCCYCRGCCNCV